VSLYTVSAMLRVFAKGITRACRNEPICLPLGTNSSLYVRPKHLLLAKFRAAACTHFFLVLKPMESGDWFATGHRTHANASLKSGTGRTDATRQANAAVIIEF
jgi:hypothetical protein